MFSCCIVFVCFGIVYCICSIVVFVDPLQNEWAQIQTGSLQTETEYSKNFAREDNLLCTETSYTRKTWCALKGGPYKCLRSADAWLSHLEGTSDSSSLWAHVQCHRNVCPPPCPPKCGTHGATQNPNQCHDLVGDSLGPAHRAKENQVSENRETKEMKHGFQKQPQRYEGEPNERQKHVKQCKSWGEIKTTERRQRREITKDRFVCVRGRGL